MDLQEQLKNLFPDHIEELEEASLPEEKQLWIQDEPMICKFEKRKGKPTTIIEGYTGADEDFKILEEIEAKIGKNYINTKAFGFIESKNQISPKELYKLKQKYETVRPQWKTTI